MQTACHNIYEKQVNGLLSDCLIQIENKHHKHLTALSYAKNM
jgi:hypothetical protein